MTDRRDAGRWGEDRAAEFLLQNGYALLARNVRTAYGEIDLVAQKEDSLIFVEVKARRSASLGPPEISITPRKLAHMRSAAEAYVQNLPAPPASWRLDVVAVTRLPGQPLEIVHFENVAPS
ncbi:MAG: YraN family protein [Chloroflexi bacterium]|nr:YraN family protein [Chloroflexota bacterium]